MAQFYGFSITTHRGETFKIEGAHSFEEAIKMVERGIYERDLEIEAKQRKESKSVAISPTTEVENGRGATAPALAEPAFEQPPAGQSVGPGIGMASGPTKE